MIEGENLVWFAMGIWTMGTWVLFDMHRSLSKLVKNWDKVGDEQ